MRLWLCSLLLGLLLLVVWETTQASNSTENSAEVEKWSKLIISRNLSFLCNPKMLRSNVSSISVNALRPSDVKLVASIGNKEIFPDLSIAGTMDQLNRAEKMSQDVCLGASKVLSDIIRTFNPTALNPVCIPRRKVAPQPVAEHLWTQATDLVRIMKENPQLDFEHDWKVVNVFISNANQCYLCPLAGQQNFLIGVLNKLAKTLDFLHQEVPRILVNLVDLTEVLEYLTLTETGSQDRDNTESCKCSEETVLAKVVARWSYQETWEWILASSEYNQEESFALVLQPFFYETVLSSFLKEQPLQDPTDLGLHLWNVMVEPAGHKDQLYNMRERRLVKCPSKEHPYLFTYRNSNYQPSLSMTHHPVKQEDILLVCPDNPSSEASPFSVHRLKPADIKIVAAVGDAFTAANGAGSSPLDIKDILTEYRGLSWSIGGDESLRTIITLPNILRQFNSYLKGYSIGTGKQTTDGARLNQAVSRAFSEDLPNQVSVVIKMLKNDKKINYQEDWKLLTIFIGGDDLCDLCNDQAIHSPEAFLHNIQHALDILHTEVPRMFVNMVLPMELSGLREMSQIKRLSCNALFLRHVCPCLMMLPDGDPQLDYLIEVNREYQEQVEILVESGRYDTRDDFTVVLQPFLERFKVPRTEEGLPDLTYFAPDCFHFSQKTHGHIASALWNNMLEPVGQKTRQHDFTSNITIRCPDQAQPFLGTRKNKIRDTSKLEAYGSTLACTDTSPSSSVPTSVHSLKPADVKVVAALGDYFTAGSGIGSEPDIRFGFTTDYRGLSFSGGGDGSLDNVTTLPNILRVFNSQLIGYGTCTGDAKSISAFLNQAVPNAKAKNLVSQAKALVQRMKKTKEINFNEDWKVITVMIGTVDICEFCKNMDEHSGDKFLNHIRNGLDYLHSMVPRALVNLMDLMDPYTIRKLREENPKKYVNPGNGSSELSYVEYIAMDYQNALQNLLGSSRYDSKEDFTVVLHQIMRNMHIPYVKDGRLDMSFFISDHFHPSQKFHSQLAKALWNSMLQPLGKKMKTMNLGEEITLQCPENLDIPFFRTKKNSNYQYPDIIVPLDWGSDFPCDVRTSTMIPTSVHELQPSDIKVVAALGDWVTTAFGANSYNDTKLISWNGLSWSIGGDKGLEKHTTLPNILRKFNPQLRGLSDGTWLETIGMNVASSSARFRWGTSKPRGRSPSPPPSYSIQSASYLIFDSTNWRLNVDFNPGSTSWDLPTQANQLLEKLETTPGIDIANDWKLITIFIGIDDLCNFCSNQDTDIIQNFFRNLTHTLDIFFDKLPRVFINLVEIMQVVPMYQKLGGKCAQPAMFETFCPCLRISQTSSENEELKNANEKFQTTVYDLASKEEYQKREDFAVVSQPFFRKSIFPLDTEGNTDPHLFSEDCFHFSALTQNEMAVALWNNMLEPVGKKSTSHDFIFDRNKLKCPSTDNPYLFTNKRDFGKDRWRFWLVVSLMLFFFPVLITALVAAARRTTVSYLDRTQSMSMQSLRP